jgi:hypothetical protein
MLMQLRVRCQRCTALWKEVPHVSTCARRLIHAGRPSLDSRAPLSAQAIKLRRAMWMRMDPVERWTSLVDLGRRGAYLIEKAHAPAVGDAVNVTLSPSSLSEGSGKRLGSSDDKVCFSDAATAAHRQLCTAFPYAARLHLCLSVLLWVRCLRDVQDTLARVRLPYAVVRRPQRYAVADVFPTRLSEYWVDVHTTVSTKMNVQLNSTAEQVPAPHTWDVETAETIEDAATESTIALNAGRVLHGSSTHRRLSGRALLRQVQGVQPRESADDEVATRVTDGGRRRRRHRRLLKGGEKQAVSLPGPSALSTDNTANKTQERRGGASLEFLPDAARRVPPVSLETQPQEDAAYHGNTRRGEGCPMNDDGESTPNPIYINVPPCSPGNSRSTRGNSSAAVETEVLLRHCVMAHTAILSSLYIEGRVVDFTTNNVVVVAYVQWLFEELISDHYLSVKLIDAAAATAEQYRPYFPTWCWRSVLVLLPPKVRGTRGLHNPKTAGYSTALLKDWAARIAQAAPCSVIVEGGEGDAAASYVQKLKQEVQRLQQRRMCGAVCNDDDATASPQLCATRSVEWVPIITRDTSIDAPAQERCSSDSMDSGAASEGHSASASKTTVPFQPQRATPSTRWSLSAASAALYLLNRQQSVKVAAAAAAAFPHLSRHHRFLQAVQETLQDRFYMCELLYSPSESCLTPYRFERWVWEQLPDNVRVVGINTAPIDVLYYFPQGVFLTQKVGNAFRYRAVERTVVAKDLVPSWSSHPLRYAATQLKRCSRRWWRHRGDVTDGLHAELSLSDRQAVRRHAAAAAAQKYASFERSSPQTTAASSLADTGKMAAHGETSEGDNEEVASNALVRERVVEYLAAPSKWSLFGLAAARFFRV